MSLPATMTVLDRLERAFSRFAIPGLIRYVVALNTLVFLLMLSSPAYEQFLMLNRAAILHGEIWRLVSWIFLPEIQITNYGMITFLFYLWFTWWIGDVLEATWGTFRLNAYFFLGMLFCIGSALFFGASRGNLPLSQTFFLNLSLLLAVATMDPNLEIYLFGIIPLKIKWVALFSMLIPAYFFLLGSLPAKIIVVMCLGNYLIFFGPAFFRGTLDRQKVRERRARFETARAPANDSLHRCEYCGITEITSPDAEFRVSANGHEYCVKHLPNRSV